MYNTSLIKAYLVPVQQRKRSRGNASYVLMQCVNCDALKMNRI